MPDIVFADLTSRPALDLRGDARIDTRMLILDEMALRGPGAVYDVESPMADFYPVGMKGIRPRELWAFQRRELERNVWRSKWPTRRRRR